MAERPKPIAKGVTALQRNREEVVNTQLAILISRLGVTADAETIHVHGRDRPDVLFQLRGLRVVIEGKFADHPNAEQVVLNDARNRVRSGIAHIAIVVYPVVLVAAYPFVVKLILLTVMAVLRSSGTACRCNRRAGSDYAWSRGASCAVF